MLREFENYIFDMDGTLINSSQEVLICLKKAFLNANVEFDESRLTSDVIGPPLVQIMLNIQPSLRENSKKLEEVLYCFRRIYDFDERDISIIYPKVEDCLTFLKQKGKRLFIATYKPQAPALRLVERFFPETFEDVYTIDKFGESITKDEMINDMVARYGLEKSQTVMIGDAPSDVIAGKLADVSAIGVLWGYGSDKSELIKHADYVIHDMEELKF